LRLSGLVVAQQGKLKVYNRIYESVFNLNWVEEQLTHLRNPDYSQALAAWSTSNHQAIHLLQGQALRNAETWSVGKSLSEQDRQFIAASQELENCKIRQRIRNGSRILAIIFLVAMGMGIAAFQAFQSAKHQQYLAEDYKADAEKAQQNLRAVEKKLESTSNQVNGLNLEKEKLNQQLSTARNDVIRTRGQAQQAQIAAIAADKSRRQAVEDVNIARSEKEDAQKQTQMEQRRAEITRLRIGTAGNHSS
jgi:hypothetical protein